MAVVNDWITANFYNRSVMFRVVVVNFPIVGLMKVFFFKTTKWKWITAIYVAHCGHCQVFHSVSVSTVDHYPAWGGFKVDKNVIKSAEFLELAYQGCSKKASTKLYAVACCRLCCNCDTEISCLLVFKKEVQRSPLPAGPHPGCLYWYSQCLVVGCDWPL